MPKKAKNWQRLSMFSSQASFSNSLIKLKGLIVTNVVVERNPLKIPKTRYVCLSVADINFYPKEVPIVSEGLFLSAYLFWLVSLITLDSGDFDSNPLGGTKPQISAPKRYSDHSYHFIPPPPPGSYLLSCFIFFL